MLIELRIENLAVIERVSLRPDRGLNVLTGETGAGKSIIVGALSLLLGERASSDVVRAGTSRAIVEGVFDVSSSPAVRALLDEHGIDDGDGLLILRREVAAEGRSRAWVNGSATTASFVADLGALLVDLHGQHEHQSLLLPARQRDIVDAFENCAELAARTAAAWTRVRDVQSRLDRLDQTRREVEQRAELLRFQADEIDRAKVVPDEETELEAEANRLEHAEELSRIVASVHEGLYAGDDAVTGRLDEMRRTIDHLQRLDPATSEWGRILDESFFALQELGRQTGDYAARIEHDPERLEQIRRRLDVLFRLQAKYGPALADVIENGQRARAELALLDDATVERDRLLADLAEARTDHSGLCVELSKRRRAAAARLDAGIGAALPELGMPDAVFTTILEPVDRPGEHGAENVEFRVTVNAGFEPGPIARVASGGELSRIMLALKATLAAADRVPTLVFDEIDAGVAGRAAHRVAERLRHVARHHQVFVVTHLAQIAARADHHHLVEKRDAGGLAATALRELRDDARVNEVARLLGGDPESGASIAHARELLDGARAENAAAPSSGTAATSDRQTKRSSRR